MVTLRFYAQRFAGCESVNRSVTIYAEYRPLVGKGVSSMGEGSVVILECKSCVFANVDSDWRMWRKTGW